MKQNYILIVLVCSFTISFAQTNKLFPDGNVGIGTLDPQKKLEVNGDISNKGMLYQNSYLGQGSGAHGINWYNPDYTTWLSYMAPAGFTNAPNGAPAPLDAPSNVTTWALRSNIENATTYGWIFESGANGAGNVPTVKFAINSYSGTFHTIGDGLIDGNMGVGTTTPSKKLEVNGDILNKGILYQNTYSGQGSGAHGISWYRPDYTTWFNYMAPAGNTNAPSGTAAPSDIASGVSSWALRSNIENVPNYGWIFESAVNGPGNVPTVKFAINSNNGTFHSTGNGIIDGDMAIGTTETKGYKLAVNGNIRSQEIKVENINWPDYVFANEYTLPSLKEIDKHIKEKGHLPGIPSAVDVKSNGVNLGEMNAKLLEKIEELTLHLIKMDKKIEHLESENEALRLEIRKK